MALQELETAASEAQAKRNIVQAIEKVAERLGNTPAVCRRCYVHPAVLESYLNGTMHKALQTCQTQETGDLPPLLPPAETVVLSLLLAAGP